MCVICVKEKGVKMPTMENIKAMWEHNPDGAGYMLARNGYVYIRKGFMKLSDFLSALETEKITTDDVIIMHFRISTQGGVNKAMTHPFALSTRLEDMKELNVMADVGVVHNGIIRMTTDFRQKEYSDTALFVANYLSKLIRTADDFYDEEIKEMIFNLIGSKMVLLNGNGDIQMIGEFAKRNGLWYSNLLHEYKPSYHSIWMQQRAEIGRKLQK